LIALASVSQTHAQSAPKETPLSVVNALHAAFGQHHDRAVHTKGTILEGTFTPALEARTIVRTPVFAGGPLPVVARFSLFAGVPTPAGQRRWRRAVRLRGQDQGARWRRFRYRGQPAA
jgi:catalase